MSQSDKSSYKKMIRRDEESEKELCNIKEDIEKNYKCYSIKKEVIVKDNDKELTFEKKGLTDKENEESNQREKDHLGLKSKSKAKDKSTRKYRSKSKTQKKTKGRSQLKNKEITSEDIQKEIEPIKECLIFYSEEKTKDIEEETSTAQPKPQSNFQKEDHDEKSNNETLSNEESLVKEDAKHGSPEENGGNGLKTKENQEDNGLIEKDED